MSSSLKNGRVGRYAADAVALIIGRSGGRSLCVGVGVGGGAAAAFYPQAFKDELAIVEPDSSMTKNYRARAAARRGRAGSLVLRKGDADAGFAACIQQGSAQAWWSAGEQGYKSRSSQSALKSCGFEQHLDSFRCQNQSHTQNH